MFTSFFKKGEDKEINMIKNTIYFFCLMLNILLAACTNIIDNPIKQFAGRPVETIIPSKIIDLEEFGIFRPFHFIQIDDSTFIIQDLKDNNIFNLINLSSKKVIAGVNKGQGPDEVLTTSSFLYRDSKILIWDVIKKRMNEIVLSSDSTLAIKEKYKIDVGSLIIYRINPLDSTFIATGQFEDYWLVEMNKEGKIFSTIDYPIWKETKDILKTALPTLYNAFMANSHDNKKVVVVTSNQGVISFLNRTYSGIKEYKQMKYHAPKFSITEKGAVAYSKNNIEGFWAVDCDNSYVYALYSGRTFNSDHMESNLCEHLLVYDWDGNPIKRYILDIPIYKMSYNKSKNCIYGLTNNPEGVLVEYKL